MNSQFHQEHGFTKDTHQLMDQSIEEALAYAEHEFGVGHPIWQSIHDQVACFCKCSQECAEERSKDSGSKRPRETH